MNKNGGKNLTTSSVVDNIIRVRILVVDDDKICLAVTASVLKLFNYEVVTINCPLEALSTLRMTQDSFDIILSDVHMPLMSGLNFQRIVEFEFQIPVILMSADDQKDILLKSLENGAAFFIVKPPSINDLKNMWQYVISRKNAASNKSSICKESVPSNETVNKNLNNNEVFPQTTYTNNDDLSCDYKTKPVIVQKVENITEEKSARSNSKKPKLIWTTALHNKFLEAISVIGTNRAVPKKILEYMNVPGLTRENIASHLQKYRIYVRRLSDSNGSMQHGMPLNWNERPFRSSFSWSQFPTLANNSFLLKYSNSKNHTPSQERTSIPNYGSQTNPFLHQNNPFAQQSANNIDTNYVHDNLDYNNLTQPMHILESSGLDPHNNNIYEDNGLINRVQPQTTSQQYQYFDGAFDNLTNTITQVSGFETHNNNVANNFMRQPVVNISSNFHNNEQFHVTNLNIISKDHQQVTIMSDLNAITTVQEEGEPNKSNTSTRQIVVRNNDNVTIQNREDATTTFNFTGTTSAPMQDWAPNQLADFSMDNYGVEDFSTIFSNIDGPKENNNN